MDGSLADIVDENDARGRVAQERRARVGPESAERAVHVQSVVPTVREARLSSSNAALSRRNTALRNDDATAQIGLRRHAVAVSREKKQPDRRSPGGGAANPPSDRRRTPPAGAAFCPPAPSWLFGAARRRCIGAPVLRAARCPHAAQPCDGARAWPRARRDCACAADPARCAVPPHQAAGDAPQPSRTRESLHRHPLRREGAKERSAQ